MVTIKPEQTTTLWQIMAVELVDFYQGQSGCFHHVGEPQGLCPHVRPAKVRDIAKGQELCTTYLNPNDLYRRTRQRGGMPLNQLVTLDV